jgi:hypothetical protein
MVQSSNRKPQSSVGTNKKETFGTTTQRCMFPLNVFLKRHPLSPFSKRGLLSAAILVVSVAIATLAMHYFEGWSITDSFFFITMLTTTQGPTATPSTFWGKVFASLYAYYSVGLLVTTIGLMFGPMLGYAVKRGVDYVEKEEKKLRKEL